MGECGTTYGGLSGKTKEDFNHGEAWFVPYTNVFENPIADKDRLESVEIDPKQNQVKFGDALFTVSSETPEEVGMSSVWLSDQPNVYLNSFCFGYRQDGSFDLSYLAYMLRSQSVRDNIALLAQGISRFNISKNKVMELEVPFPEKNEQAQIGSLFQKLDSLITLHQREQEQRIETTNAIVETVQGNVAYNHPRVSRRKAVMIDLKTLTMQVINGDAEGIKICRIAGSTLVTIVIPRELLPEAKGLPEIPKRGVYYLLDDNKGRLRRVYAGQTVQGIQRLDDHNQRKSWWNKAVMFLAPDSEFSMDVVSGLESLAIKYIREHGAYEVENTNDPKPYVSPYNEAFIHSLHDDILFRMMLLGFGLDAIGDDVAEETDRIFHTTRRGVKGLGRYNAFEGSFDVLPGSEIDVCTVPGTQNKPNSKLESLRRKLIDSEGLRARNDGLFELASTLHFESPSAAAVFVLGGSCNGWTEWVDDTGRTLSSVYRDS